MYSTPTLLKLCIVLVLMAMLSLGCTSPENGSVTTEEAKPSQLRTQVDSDSLVIQVSEKAEYPNLLKVISKNRAIHHTEILINAPVEKVWEVATDFERMHEWSPSYKNIEGDKRHGAAVTLVVKDYAGTRGGKDLRVQQTLVWVEGQRFGWSGGGVSGNHLFDNHMFLFIPVDEKTTLFMQTDDITNVASDLTDLTEESTLAFIRDVVEKNFMGFNEALKERVESLYPSQ